MTYTAPATDIEFALTKLTSLSNFEGHPAFENYDPDLITPILDEAGKLARDVLAPLNQSGDKAGANVAFQKSQSY